MPRARGGSWCREVWILSFAPSRPFALPGAAALAGSGGSSARSQRLRPAADSISASGVDAAVKSVRRRASSPPLAARLRAVTASLDQPRTRTDSAPRFVDHRQRSAAPAAARRTHLQRSAASAAPLIAAVQLHLRSIGRCELPGTEGAMRTHVAPLTTLVSTLPRCSFARRSRPRTANNMHSPNFPPNPWQATTHSSSTSISQKPGSP